MIGLVSVWSDRRWRFAEGSKTLAGDIWASWMKDTVTGTPILTTVAGDLAPPSLPYPAPPENLIPQ